MNVLALDLSPTATGVAYPDGTVTTWSPKLQGPARLKWFRQQVDDLLLTAEHTIDVIVIEGYAFGRPNQATAIGELGGVVKLCLHDHGATWLPIPPSNVKQYATGKGNAKKSEVLTAAVRRLGYRGSDDNQSDALWLRAMTLDHYGAATVIVPETHRKALAKITWPDVAVPA